MRVFIRLFFLIYPVASFANTDLDVFVMGDSQIGYNHYVGFEMFFNDPKSLCGDNYPVSKFSYAGYGASGSGFHNWVETITEKDNEHGQVCNPDDDKRWFGSGDFGETIYYEYTQSKKEKQNGTTVIIQETFRDEDGIWKNVCTPGKRPIDRVLELKPKIVVASFLGAHIMQKKEELQEAIKAFEDSLPQDIPCIVITSPPGVDAFRAFTDEQIESREESHLNDINQEITWIKKRIDSLKTGLTAKELQSNSEYQSLVDHLKKINSSSYRDYLKEVEEWNTGRGKAAERVHRVVLNNGRCQLVKGFDEAVYKNISNDFKNYLNPEILEYFNTTNQARFDPFHLSEEGSINFFKLKRDEICTAFDKAYSEAIDFQKED